jgi:acetyl esterase/lipase
LAAGIAQRTGGAVYVLDYRLAPEYPFPAAVDDAVAAFAHLVDVLGHSPERIALAGDSAGGNLALVTARRVIDERGQRPAALALISPWADPGAVLPAKRDTLLNAPWLHACAAAYLGDADPTDTRFAPLHGDLSGLPPTIVQIGTTELFYAQVKRLAEGIEAAGGEVTLQEYPKLWHVAQLQASQVREAAEAVDEIGRFLRARLDAV